MLRVTSASKDEGRPDSPGHLPKRLGQPISAGNSLPDCPLQHWSVLRVYPCRAALRVCPEWREDKRDLFWLQAVTLGYARQL